jgi:von Willebrand factor type A domain
MQTLQELHNALSAIEERILVLKNRPEKAGVFWSTFAAPWYRLFGYRPTFSVEKISNLVEEIQSRKRYRGLGTFDAMIRSLQATHDPLPGLFGEAVEELERNVAASELGVRTGGSLAPTHGHWLGNIAAVLRRLWPLVDDSSKEWDRRVAEAVSPFAIAPPLLGFNPSSRAERSIGSGKLASIDALIASARQENQSLERRRRLLEAARETLIECNASLDLDSEATKYRQRAIADDLCAIARLGAAGIKTNVKTSHQLDEAHRRGEWVRLHAGLVGLEQMALQANHERTGEIAHDVIEKIWQGRNRFEVAKSQESSLRSVDEVFGAETKARLSRGISSAKTDYRSPNASEKVKEIDPGDIDFVKRHVESLDTSVYLNGLLSVDGCFDVGGVLTPTRVVEEKRLRRTVSYPTGQLTLEPAESAGDIPDAAISDPRTVIPDLATGKLLARRFIRDEVQKTNRTVLLGELRIYLLDGSTSMLTPRSVLRDAILIAELCTIIARLNDAKRNVNPTLYFQYFDKEVGPVTEVVTSEQAANAIEGLLTTVRTGGTNIQAALLRSIEQIRVAQSRGMDLARANIVLVTDGESPVDESEIVNTLASLGELQTGINIIALGQENPSLKKLAAHQKEMGKRVFYQFIDDETIRKIINGERDTVCLHPPDDSELENCSDLLRETIEQIEQSERIRDEMIGSDLFLEQALGEMGTDTALRAAMKGRIELAKRNDAALIRRFERWFPRITNASTEALNYPDQRTESRLRDTVSLVDGVTEVLSLMKAEHRELQADALEVFQRSLSDAGISPFEYTELLDRFPERFQKALEKLYETVGLN